MLVVVKPHLHLFIAALGMDRKLRFQYDGELPLAQLHLSPTSPSLLLPPVLLLLPTCKARLHSLSPFNPHPLTLLVVEPMCSYNHPTPSCLVA
jgi:hypothetical protein